MTGPEHYRMAEQMLGDADGYVHSDATVTLAAAQVHATLALAAATAEPVVERGDTSVDGPSADWQEAIS